jgi:phytanoyl-CoA hydroxylase
MKVIYEPAIPEHAPSLYRADRLFEEGVYQWEALTESDARLFEEQGFLVVRGGLSAGEVVSAREALYAMTLAENPGCGSISFEGRLQERLSVSIPSEATPLQSQFSLGSEATSLPDLPPAERAGYVRKFMDFTAAHPALHAVAYQAHILQTVEWLLKEPASLFQEMAMIKPPQGREKPWHQDHAYFNFPLTGRILGVWIALGDVYPENGCMFVIAGGHREGPRSHFLRRDWQICDTETMPLMQTAIPMQAGDVLFFDGKLPHGTPINRTDQTRWALQFHYVPETAIQTEDAERLAAFGSEGKEVAC